MAHDKRYPWIRKPEDGRDRFLLEVEDEPDLLEHGRCEEVGFIEDHHRLVAMGAVTVQQDTFNQALGLPARRLRLADWTGLGCWATPT